MFTRVSDDEISSCTEVQEVTELFNDITATLAQMVRRLKAGEAGEAKEVARQMGEVRAAYKLALEERIRVAKLRKEDAGVVYDYALDLDAARDEVCRRLACLREAGDG
ncbi:hypothetical protein [Albidovulum sp.]|uniref:hypothetical protein n=1 Tax=Albidovulum sp. TaxID=1872424 RepID=UPI001D814110|nr:hypothetical protein [Paracoccaceae bacterium]